MYVSYKKRSADITRVRKRKNRINMKLPKELKEGYQNFCRNYLVKEKKRYETLAEKGQKPHSLIIACCDSRTAPETIFETKPGEIFVIRNVANIVPPYEKIQEYHSTCAAIEFGVQALGIQHIIVLGHAKCGGIAACKQEYIDKNRKNITDDDAIGKWIELLKPAAEQVSVTNEETNRKLTDEEWQKELEQESIRQSVKRLEEFPYIKEKMKKQKIDLHGTWFDIANGELWIMNETNKKFEKI